MPIPLSHQNESYILKNFVCFCINETFFYYWCIKLIQQVLGIINSIKGLNQKEILLVWFKTIRSFIMSQLYMFSKEKLGFIYIYYPFSKI